MQHVSCPSIACSSPAKGQDTDFQRCCDSPRSWGGLGKSQEQCSVPWLLEKSLSCLYSHMQSSNGVCRALTAGSSTSTEVARSTSHQEPLQLGADTASPQVLVLRSSELLQPPQLSVLLSFGSQWCWGAVMPACAGDLPAWL